MFRPVARRGLVCLRGRQFSLAAATASVALNPRTPLTSCAPLSAQLAQARRQATATAAAGILADKKFHCSVCKKPFRLEKAAQVHIAQAHAGEGRVEAGPGPGYVEGAAKPPAASSAAPPTQPATPASPWRGQAGFRGGGAAAINRNDDEDDEYYKLRNRPAPKPLHAATIDVPDAAMDALLAVWDAIGVARVDGFVHSSMVMKVFATKQVDPATFPKAYEVKVATPDGPNPFALGAHTATGGDNDNRGAAANDAASPSDEGVSAAIVEDNEMPYSSVAFAPAPPQFISPSQPAAVPNPFLAPGSVSPAAARLQPVANSPPPSSQPTTSAKTVQAPVTPYGQLPLFGSEPPAGGTSPRLGAAAAQASPFVTPASGVGAGTAADATAAAASPFASSSAAAAASPFASAAAASPFAAAPSPFASFAASPFAGSAPVIASTPFGMGSSGALGAALTEPPSVAGQPNFAGDPVPGHAVPDYPSSEPSAPPPVEKKIVCSLCGKQFRHQFDFYNHSKSKHNVEVPRKSADSPRQKKTKEGLPELPAYIPSPVELTSTSPFGAAVHPSTSLADVKLVIHGHAVSNMTLMGQVVDVGNVDGVLRLGVQNEAHEVIPVHCGSQHKSPKAGGGSGGESNSSDLAATLKRGTTVLVTGTLRLIPRHEVHSNKVYMHPVLFAVPPHGNVVAVDDRV